VFNIRDSLADRALIQGGLLVNQSGHEGRVAKLVDAARQALGVLKDAGDGIVGKELAGVVAGNLGPAGGEGYPAANRVTAPGQEQ
jgi:hypothetical protein